MSSLVVHAVTGATMRELLAARDAAGRADLVELRLDGVTDPDVAGALAGRRTPVIVTCRPAWEGGRFTGSEEERLRLLGEAIRLGAEYVDVEWRADRRSLPPVREGTRLVLSHHDFDGMPADLDDRLTAMQHERPPVLKITVTARRLRDLVTLLAAARRLDGPHVAIAMGAAGQVSRVCPWVFGSLWTYGGATAPGQCTADDLIDLYRIRTRSSATRIYGIAGSPLGHSASPAMHNPAFAAVGLDAVYVPFETDEAEDFLAMADAVGVAGASVTAPLKTALLPHVTERDALTADTGSLNTLRRTARGWEARNFDVAGFLAPLDRLGPLDGRRAVVLGAGGAARTAVWALRSRGARVEVAARRAARAAALAREFGVAASEWPPAPGWDLLVNATPVGTWPATSASPLDPDRVAGGAVYDLIYNPLESALLGDARRAGAVAIGGLEMLVSQACLQFAWWTGRAAPVETMTEAAREFVARAQEVR